MADSSRGSRRRRRARSSAAAPEGKPGTLLLKGSEPAAAGLLAGFVLLFVGIALLASGGTDNGGATSGPGDGATTNNGGATASPDGATASPGDETASPGGATASPDGETTDAVQPATSHEEAIQWLARRSIEVLPAGQWPSLYDSFTSEFQQRCPREEFAQAGEDAAIQMGDNLTLLRFKRTEGMSIEGLNAQVVIVGEIVGQGEYQIQAAFRNENGDWKIAPAPDTQGCEAFGRLNG
jgi:hypothetical protein